MTLKTIGGGNLDDLHFLGDPFAAPTSNSGADIIVRASRHLKGMGMPDSDRSGQSRLVLDMGGLNRPSDTVVPAGAIHMLPESLVKVGGGFGAGLQQAYGATAAIVGFGARDRAEKLLNRGSGRGSEKLINTSYALGTHMFNFLAHMAKSGTSTAPYDLANNAITFARQQTRGDYRKLDPARYLQDRHGIRDVGKAKSGTSTARLLVDRLGLNMVDIARQSSTRDFRDALDAQSQLRAFLGINLGLSDVNTATVVKNATRTGQEVQIAKTLRSGAGKVFEELYQEKVPMPAIRSMALLMIINGPIWAQRAASEIPVLVRLTKDFVSGGDTILRKLFQNPDLLERFVFSGLPSQLNSGTLRPYAHQILLKLVDFGWDDRLVNGADAESKVWKSKDAGAQEIVSYSMDMNSVLSNKGQRLMRLRLTSDEISSMIAAALHIASIPDNQVPSSLQRYRGQSASRIVSGLVDTWYARSSEFRRLSSFGDIKRYSGRLNKR